MAASPVDCADRVGVLGPDAAVTPNRDEEASMGGTPTDASSPDTIVLIHGLWLTPRSWERWVERYGGAGYRVLAPAWPGLEGDVDGLRRDPSPLARSDIPRIVNSYEGLIRGLDRPPVLVGHSFGGTIVQLLLDRGLGSAGVAIAPAMVRGVLHRPLSTLRATWPALRNPMNRRRAVPMTPEQFHYAFTNTMTRDESMRAYERYYVPASGRVLFQTMFANLSPRPVTRVDLCNNDRAPLLLVAGRADHLMPISVVRENAGRYRRATAITAYHEMPGRSHFTIVQDGWEEVADFALDWALDATAAHYSRAR